MIAIQHDTLGQPYIEWEQTNGILRRAWVQTRTDPVKDWARTGRYINVVRIEEGRQGSGGIPTDFPIFSDRLSDEQILEAFVAAVCAITGCQLPTATH